jgi:hypothetical protein
MAFYIRRQPVAYDNIAVGSATGRERVINQSGVTAAMSTEPPRPDNTESGSTIPSTDIPERFASWGGGLTTPATGSTAYIAEKKSI